MLSNTWAACGPQADLKWPARVSLNFSNFCCKDDVTYKTRFSTENFNANLVLASSDALRLLWTHGLQPQELHLVARATTVASIMYATLAWWGFAGEGDRLRLEQLIARMRRRGYLPSDFPNIASLAEEADHILFESIIQCQTHVLRHLFIDKLTSTRSLRVRAHCL